MTTLGHFVEHAAAGQWTMLGVVAGACVSALWLVWFVVSAHHRDRRESDIDHARPSV